MGLLGAAWDVSGHDAAEVSHVLPASVWPLARLPREEHARVKGDARGRLEALPGSRQSSLVEPNPADLQVGNWNTALCETLRARLPSPPPTDTDTAA